MKKIHSLIIMGVLLAQFMLTGCTDAIKQNVQEDKEFLSETVNETVAPKLADIDLEKVKEISKPKAYTESSTSMFKAYLQDDFKCNYAAFKGIREGIGLFDKEGNVQDKEGITYIKAEYSVNTDGMLYKETSVQSLEKGFITSPFRMEFYLTDTENVWYRCNSMTKNVTRLETRGCTLVNDLFTKVCLEENYKGNALTKLANVADIDIDIFEKGKSTCFFVYSDGVLCRVIIPEQDVIYNFESYTAVKDDIKQLQKDYLMCGYAHSAIISTAVL